MITSVVRDCRQGPAAISHCARWAPDPRGESWPLPAVQRPPRFHRGASSDASAPNGTAENRAPSSAVLLGIAGMHRRRPTPDLLPGTWLDVAAAVGAYLAGDTDDRRRGRAAVAAAVIFGSARLVPHSLALPVAPQDWTPARARRERLRSAMHCTRAATRYSLGCGMLRAELCCERLTTPEGAASERRQAGR